MAIGNKVQFAYIATGSSLPSSYPNPDTIYFLEESKEIRVGSKVFAYVNTDVVDPSTLEEILEAYAVKNIDITGTGDNVSNITFNTTTGRIAVTKSNLPVLAKGAAPTPSSTTLSPSGTFEVVTDTSVSGHTITDNKTKFTLPKQINNLLVTTSGSKLIFTLVFSDGTTQAIEYTGLGTAAFANSTDFATAAQGTKADGAMPASNGVATNAEVTLKRNPVSNMDAATKQYVDSMVESAASNVNFLGVSTSAITDGGTQSPTINGAVVPISTVSTGDWVVYDNIQYIWDGAKWTEFGGSTKLDEYVKRITAGEGLHATTSGTASEGRVVAMSHQTKFPDTQSISPSTDLEVINGAQYDKFGHVISLAQHDLTNSVTSLITNATTPISNELGTLQTNLANNYYTRTQVDQQLSDYITQSQLDTAIEDVTANVFSVVVPASSWTVTGDGTGAYSSTRIAESTAYHYYDIHLAPSTSRAVSLMCANAAIEARVEYNGIFLYSRAGGVVPTRDFTLEVVEFVTKNNTITMSYDIGDDFLAYPGMIEALDERVTALEDTTPNMILMASNIQVEWARWTASDNATYPYKAEITMEDVTPDYYPVVQYSDESVAMYDFSPVSYSGDNTITIMCKTHPNTYVTIASIVCYKATVVTAR